MNNDRIELHGNAGVYITDGNVLSLQIGEGEQLFANPGLFIPRAGELQQYEHQWLSVNGFQICMRGINNALCDEVALVRICRQSRMVNSRESMYPCLNGKIGSIPGKSEALKLQHKSSLKHASKTSITLATSLQSGVSLGVSVSA